MASTTTEPQGTTLHLTRTTAELKAARIALVDAINAASFDIPAVTACAEAINLINACIDWQAENPAGCGGNDCGTCPDCDGV